MAKLKMSLGGIKEEGAGVDFVPAGNYLVKCVGSEVKETGNNASLVIHYEIIEGEKKGSQLKDVLNIIHSNQDAQRIALSRLKRLLSLSDNNPEFIEDSEVLHGKVFIATLTEDEWEMTDERTNETKKIPTNRFKKYNKPSPDTSFPPAQRTMEDSIGVPSESRSSAQSQAQSAPQSKPKRPWEK